MILQIYRARKVLSILYAMLAPLLLLCSCQKDKPPALTGCCGNLAIDEAFGNGHIYVANIFTPDGDGWNDYLAIYGDSLKEVTDLVIVRTNDDVVFSANTLIPNEQIEGWNGEINGVVYEEIYTIRFTAKTTNGTSKSFQSKVCIYLCEDGANENKYLINAAGCQFPAQVDHGRYNHNIPSGEQTYCFE